MRSHCEHSGSLQYQQVHTLPSAHITLHNNNSKGAPRLIGDTFIPMIPTSLVLFSLPTMSILHTLPPLTRVRVIRRPSAIIKSPYVADIEFETGEQALCHTPGLGCSGLVAPGRTVFVSCATNPLAKTQYTTQMAECEDAEGTYYVGVHPMISQAMAGQLLHRISANNTIWKSEVKLDAHTRIDFVGTTMEGKTIYVEVKNAMISHQASTVERASRRAVFPDGFRVSKQDTFSPRALKHAACLAERAVEPNTEAYLLYLVPRSDCGGGLELNVADPVYRACVAKAVNQGVKVRVFGLAFDRGGNITFTQELPFAALD